MKRRSNILGVLITVAAMLTSSLPPHPTLAEAGGPEIREGGATWLGAQTGPEFVPDEIVVRFRPGVAAQAIEAINRSQGATTAKVGARSGLYRIGLPKGVDLEAVLTAYRARPEVASASRNAIVRVLGGPNDPYYSYQWHLDNPTWGGIHWQAVWEHPDRPLGTGVPVAIIDTGVAWDNPYATDLAGQSFLILPGSDIANADDNPTDDHGHGTHVAGTIAQATDDGVGVAGVAPGATIVPIKVLDATGSGSDLDVVEGIYLAIGATAPCTYDPATPPPARVINMSLAVAPGTTLDQLPGLAEALECANEREVVVVAAAGNNGTTDVPYPAKYPTVIAVGATTIDERYAFYSNRGTDLDIVAPGGEDCSGFNILMCMLSGTPSADINGDGYIDGILQQTFAMGSDPNRPENWGWYFLSGTSMASPHVAGVAALVRGINPGLSAVEVGRVLTETAETIGLPDGRRLVNAAAAVQRAVDSLGSNQPPVANAGADQTANEGQILTFDGSGSSDPDGTIVSYQWNFGDGATGSGAVASHAYNDNGSYDATLTVTDDRGTVATDTAVITVNNVAPTAEAGGPYSGIVGQPIAFTGSATDPGTADTHTYSWDFGDGSPPATGQQVSHTYSVSGTFTAVLTVTDDDLGVGQDTATVTVSANPTPSPTPTATPTPTTPSSTATPTPTPTPSPTPTSSATPIPSPTAYLNIDMSKQLSPRWWKATAAVSIRETDASGLPVKGATVYGHWSGAYSGSVSGTTNKNGVVEFRTSSITTSEQVTFTVDQVVKAGQTYTLTGETSDWITR